MENNDRSMLLTLSNPDDKTRPEEHRLDEPRLDDAAEGFRRAFQSLGLDLRGPDLKGTERRVARAYRELFAGLYAAPPDLKTFPNTEGYSEMVAVTDIPFHSLCAHHMLPFFGRAHVAYLPKERLVGLSKLARVVDFYARRPQSQEKLTEQIIRLLENRLRPLGAMVIIQARHFCIEMRGVGKPGALTTTSAIRGAFDDQRTRQEFLGLLKTSQGRDA
jgi:GTP cyclohydrolase IA